MTGWRRPVLEAAGRAAFGLSVAGWLWPLFPLLEALGNLTRSSAFLPYVVVLGLLQALPWRVLRGVGAVVLTGVGICRFYGPPLFPTLSGPHRWWAVLRLVAAQVQDVIQAGTGLVDPLQTTVFMLLVCVLFWCLCVLARHTYSWLAVVFVAICTLCWVDANTPVNPVRETVWMLLWGTALQGIAHGWQLTRRLLPEGGVRPGPLALRMGVPLAGFLAVAGGVAWAGPKPDAAWPNPWSHVHTPGPAPAGAKVIGYSDDVSQLGGDFIQDQTPRLTVVASQPVYLRGAAYNTYDGHGWTEDTTVGTALPVGEVNPLFDDTFFRNTLLSRTVRVQVSVVNADGLRSNHLFVPYAPLELTTAKLRLSPGSLGVDEDGSIWTGVPYSTGDTYTALVRMPEDPTAVLSALPPHPSSKLEAPLAAVVDNLQLPPDLPLEVRSLAQQLTAGARNEYDAVERVIDYLQSHEQYATQGIPVPAEGQDFVDQFLFQTHRGYCTHFASAAAVLLRAAGYPTRFVTGFADGELDPDYNGPGERFIVRNADAHAWIEVYFPGFGWVPFDPTPGFTMPWATAATTASPSGADNNTTSAPAPAPRKQSANDASTENSSGAGGGPAVWRVIEEAAVGLVVVGAIAALVFRRRIALWWVLRRWPQPTATGLTRAVCTLLRLLQREGIISTGAVTVRHLLPASARSGVAVEDALQLVTAAESLWYAGRMPSPETLAAAHAVWVRWVRAVLASRRSRRTAAVPTTQGSG